MTSSVILKCFAWVLKALPQRLRCRINLFRNHLVDIHDVVGLIIDRRSLLLEQLLVKAGAQMEARLMLISSRFPEARCRVYR